MINPIPWHLFLINLLLSQCDINLIIILFWVYHKNLHHIYPSNFRALIERLGSLDQIWYRNFHNPCSNLFIYSLWLFTSGSIGRGHFFSMKKNGWPGMFCLSIHALIMYICVIGFFASLSWNSSQLMNTRCPYYNTTSVPQWIGTHPNLTPIKVGSTIGLITLQDMINTMGYFVLVLDAFAWAVDLQLCVIQ